VLLRAALKDVGLRPLEREATYALQHIERCYNWPAFCPPQVQEVARHAPPGFFATLDGLFNFVFFELTCAYALKPGRPLLILLGFIPGFACFYGLALWKTNRHAGIWVTYSADRTYKRRDAKREWQTRVQQGIQIPSSTGRGNNRRETKREWRTLVTHRPPKMPQNTMTEASRRPTRQWGLSVHLSSLLCRLRALPRNQSGSVPSLVQVKPWQRTCCIALYFSLLSAFHLGWRELNVGTWLTRMQKRPYTLSATGWVRFVSGLQSLLSVYLLALWALSYFGRPFE
jgi:hypothetical protein